MKNSRLIHVASEIRCVCLIFALLSALGLSAQTPPMPQVSLGSLERLEVEPSNGLPARLIDVWLPPGYDPSHQHAVVYMHDGQSLFDAGTTWNGQEWGIDETLGELIESGEIPPVIVVGIWNAGPEHRHPEYFPQKPFKSLPDATQRALLAEGRSAEGPQLFKGNVRSDRYLSFLVDEVIPFIESRYPVSQQRSQRFIAGSSMGGLISIYAICEYPDAFGGAACLSTHWPGIFHNENNPIPDAFVEYLAENLPPPGDHRLYFDRGDQTLDALYAPHQDRVDALMQAKGFVPDFWMTRAFPGTDHSESAWRDRFSLPIAFLLSAGDES